MDATSSEEVDEKTALMLGRNKAGRLFVTKASLENSSPANSSSPQNRRETANLFDLIIMFVIVSSFFLNGGLWCCLVVSL